MIIANVRVIVQNFNLASENQLRLIDHLASCITVGTLALSHNNSFTELVLLATIFLSCLPEKLELFH